MGISAFMGFKGAVSESQDEDYLGYMEIQSFDWEITAETSVNKGTGSSVGKAKAGAAKFKHYFDKASPTMLNFITKGTHFEEVYLRVLKNTGGDKPECYFFSTFKTVFITNMTFSIDDEGRIDQDAEFVFKAVDILYKPQDNTGKLGADYGFTFDTEKNVAGTAVNGNSKEAVPKLK